ncbi:TIGR00341 family protein [Natrinema halophilum]|uniref:TIGR00341 family protein n=1 Tax=Natrinema halophilum TaxID=1699371 RepID=A0A7D5GLV9_9EURY|nr:TIGR00341 family protein [Natrinema halophilum]QLG50250.1 TIGR00341 family protein [Natrinema halophilum]
MRLVQVLVPDGNRESVIAALDEQGIDYAVFEETGRGEFEAMVQFPVPPTGVEPVLENLRSAGISESAYTIVLPTETVVSERIESLQALYPGNRVSREVLKANAQSLAPARSTYFAFIVLSTIIATGGLLLDSAATIIGAMVVAPLMGPAITASAGSVLADRELATRGITLQVVGLMLAIAVAAALGALLRGTVIVPPGTDIRTIPQVAERTSPDFLSLFIAFGSGIAGAISVSRGSGSTLVGVAIAVALIPPAATAGLGIAWGFPEVAASATVLVLVNLLSINLSALAIFWLSGYRPELTDQRASVRTAVLRRGAVLVIALVVLSVVLGLVTFASYQTTTFEHRATAETERFFDESSLSEYELESVAVAYDSQDIVLENDPTVTVIVGRSNATAVRPNLADRLDRHLEETTGENVGVRVGFVVAQESEPIPVTTESRWHSPLA